MTGPAEPADRHPAELVAARVLACPVVVSLSDGALAGGAGRQVATYLPGRRVVGVSWREDVCEVAVVLLLGDRSLLELAEQVRQAVEPVAQGRVVDVVVTDVVPGEAADPPFVPYET